VDVWNGHRWKRAGETAFPYGAARPKPPDCFTGGCDRRLLSDVADAAAA